MQMDKMWHILIIASLVLMTVNHPILMVLVGLGVFVYHKNPWGIKMRIVNLWNRAKGVAKPKPKNPTRRPRL